MRIKQSTALAVSFGPFLDPTDGVTLVTGAVSAIDNGSTGIKLSKNGGALTIRHATVTASTYDAYGNYIVTLDTTDTNTLGTLRMQFASAATCLPVWMDFEVVNANEWDSSFGTSVRKFTDIDQIKTNPVVNGGTVTFPTTATLASTTNITAGTITTATTAVNLTNAPTAGDFTATMKTSLNAATPAVTVSDKTGFALTAAYDPAKTAAQAATALTNVTWTDARAGYIDNLNALKIKKNTALAAFPFLMVLSSDHVTPATGLSVTATRSLDGAAFGACANAVTELANGVYIINLAAADLNGNTVVLKFTAATADQRTIVIATEP